MVKGPDHRALETDVAKAACRLAELEGWWRLVRMGWPYAYFAVTARDGREYTLRLECSGYPQAPPTGGPWDLGRDAILEFESWPQGNGGRVSDVFRTGWKKGTAVYLPCDRVSIAGHPNWCTEMPSKVWRPADGIAQYLEQVHELLNCGDYRTPAGAPA